MNVTDLILTAQNEGLILSLSDSGAIKYEGDPAAVNRWLPAIRERKAEIIEVLKSNSAFWRWRLHFPDRNPLIVSCSPEAKHAEILEQYPDAVAAEPVTPARLSSAPMPASEEQSIREWLAAIGETDSAIIDETLEKCRQDADARAYFVGRVKQEPPGNVPFDVEAFEERAALCEFDGGLSRDEAEAVAWNEDDRRRCVHCLNLAENGICLAASLGGQVRARRGYKPDPAILQRCAGYRPVQDDPDRRPGRERWPEFQ
jgi:hypothetical protein